MARLRVSLSSIKIAQGIVLMNSQALQSVFLRHGRYARLGPADLLAQRAALEECLGNLPAGIDVRVTDFEAARLSSCAVVGDGVVSHLLGGYLVVRNPALTETLTRRCKNVMPLAPRLGDFLASSAFPAI